MRKTLPLLALFLIGCSIDPGKNADPVEISGHVTLKGNPVNDVTFNLQPTSKGAQAMFVLKNGEFKGKVVPGRYTYFISEGAKPASYQAIPEKFRSGAMDRQIDIGDGSKLDIKLD